MKPIQSTRSQLIIWLLLAIPVAWLALIGGTYAESGKTLMVWLDDFMGAVNTAPFSITWTEYSPRILFITLAAYGFSVMMFYASRGKKRLGEEHGSARWGNVFALCKKYRDNKSKFKNVLLTQNMKMGMDGFKHKRNLNIMVVGGSGSGKSRFFAKPNVMQANCSYIICDPKGESLRALAPMFEAKGIPITVLNLVDMQNTDCYNPFMYLRNDTDVLKLITSLIKNTTPKNSSSNDPFWDKAETALLTAFMLYLKYEAPPQDQNFSTLMYLIENAAAKEESEDYQSPVDLLFEDLEEHDSEHIAVKQYKVFKQAAGKTAKSILVSAAVRLTAFNLSEVAEMTNYDDMDFGSLGERQRAIFCVIPDNDTSLNYIVGMLYTQAFQELYYNADNKHKGRLPVHVRIVMDEFANVALPDDFERVLSTCRSREISINIIIQNIAQIKALFKDSWENLTGNCDTFLYLGGNEQSTHKYVSELLGKSTIDTTTRGVTKGKSGSCNKNYQNAGRELLTPDEVRMLDNRYALLFIRGELPVIDKKYDIMKHPNVKLTTDGGAAAIDQTADQTAPELLNDLPYEFDVDNIEIAAEYVEIYEETEENQ
ncbi:MAG: type IV secretory system conjugative DNA transfer family protein [Oscillospiraceae bacterium]|nr:type IV secretory system conjugative DNA transfer family protein [Oscillospiraceae bacterium]